MIEVRDLVKRFGAREVLRGISLSVGSGECVAVMGSSGGGKTTLLRCIAGLIAPTSGRVTVDGVDVHSDPEGARDRMGMVFQNAALFDSLDVRDNVLFGVRRHRKVARRGEQELLETTLAQVGLSDVSELLPSELSGGMRKRVGLARALALSPKVILYDEPTTGLDPLTTYQIDETIDGVRRNLGVTSLVVSHDLMSVRRIAERVAFLHGGELVFLGGPDEFLASEIPAIRELVRKTEAAAFL